MPHQHLPWHLSEPAVVDLEDIYDYTVDNFGDEQAADYLTELEVAFDCLSNNPELGRLRNEIRKGLRSIAKGSHTIFYRVLPDAITIIRVLHSSRDIHKFL